MYVCKYVGRYASMYVFMYACMNVSALVFSNERVHTKGWDP